MTGLGKVFVFFQFAVAMSLLGLGIGLYANHIDWDAKIKKENEKIKELAAERDRAEARWIGALDRLEQDERERPFRKKLYDQKLAFVEKGTLPDGAKAPAAAVTELVYVKNPDHELKHLGNDAGFLDVFGGKPVQNRGQDVPFYAKTQEDNRKFNFRPKQGEEGVLGLIPKEQDKVQQLLAEYNKLGLDINGDPAGATLPLQRGLRVERRLQDEAKANALAEQEHLKPLLANRYAETVLLLKRQNSLTARKAELEKVGVAAGP